VHLSGIARQDAKAPKKKPRRFVEAFESVWGRQKIL